ncbi:protein kinase domain-containing protein [Tundrisphaera lichenicola]|uniref:protein kinase domain-containing protein n=1 Tax=Tundrisphaera lichenicola TaxID=2029860 RepID=UPI003EB81C9E
MIRCPGDERLVQLLEEQLDRREQREVGRHLERCSRCQETLEELTQDRIGLESWASWGDSTSSSMASSPGDSACGGRWPVPSFQPVSHAPTLASLASEPEILDQGCPTVEGYEILGRLGQGGMGIVYRARQHGLERMVALKMIRAGVHAAPEHLARFRIEALAVARLRHPNVVQVYDIGQADGLPFVALELLEGGSLEARIGGTPQPERESAELLLTLAGAVAAAHRAGVAHRDLKSANVLFDKEGTPKVTDFGLAKRLDEEDGPTYSGQVMGSPSFMAPEQARGQGRVVGPAADLYALGAILYEMLTGRPPFKGASAMETLYQVVHDEPVTPSRLRPGVSRDLETICLKCLIKEPHRRYPDAESLADDLRRFLEGSPVHARRTGIRERIGKWVRRQPAAAALAGFVLLILVGVSFLGLRVLDRQEARAREVERLKLEGELILDRSDRALREGRWQDGLEQLPGFVGLIRGKPGLEPIRDRGERTIRALREGVAEQARRDRARADFDRFARARHHTQLLDTQLTGAGLSRDLVATRHAARAALEVFSAQQADGRWIPAELPPSLSESERAEIRRGRHEMLLIWADAEAQPAPGEDPLRQAHRALEILENAPAHHPSTRAYHLLRASCLDRLGDSKGSDQERKVAEQVPSSDPYSRVLIGQDLYRRGKWSAAILEFEAALQAEPDLFRAQLLLAVCQIQIGRPDAARAHLTACINREVRAIGLYMLRGFAYGEEAYEKWKQARDAVPSPPALEEEARGLFEAAEHDFRTALKLNPGPDELYGLLVNRGALRIRSQRLDEAVSDLSQAVELRRESIATHVLLGQAYRLQGRPDEAIEEFSRGIALKPDLPSLYRSRAQARLDRGKGRDTPEARDRAMEDLSEAIRLEPPDSPEAVADRARRARLLHQAGRHREALADAAEALRIDPAQAEALLVRVNAHYELKEYAEVIEACNDALARDRTSPDLYELRGLARANRMDHSGAIQDYTQALALDPSRHKPLLHRGWAYALSGAPKLALDDFDKAVRIAPDDPEAYNGRGLARVIQGEHRLAVADAEESLRKGPTDHRVAYNASRIFAKAAEVALAESLRRGIGLRQLAEDYQDRAQALIRLAIERLPDDRRADFWRDVVQHDPALAAIRRRPKFSQLAGQYGRLAK